MLPRAQRLVRSRDFQATYQRKRRVDHPALTLYVGRRSPGTVRLGFVVSKKVAGKAHDRNRIKRRLRALSLPLIPGLSTYDLIVVVRAPALLLEFTALRAVVVQLFQQAGVFSPVSDTRSPVGVINDGGE